VVAPPPVTALRSAAALAALADVASHVPVRDANGLARVTAERRQVVTDGCRHILAELLAVEEQAEVLRFLSETSTLFLAAGRRSFSVLPVCKLGARHITIDTRVLRELCHDVGYATSGKAEFVQRKLDSWRRFFALPAGFLPQDLDNPPVGKRLFTGMIRTDGVSASVVTRKWYRCRVDKAAAPHKPTAAELRERFRAKCAAWAAVKTSVVGVDPGRKEVYTWASDERRCGALGNKESYSRAHLTKHKQHNEGLLRRAGLTELLAATPSLKQGRQGTGREYLAHIEPRLDDIVRVRCGRSWKKAAFDAYVMRKKVLDAAIKELVASAGCPKSQLLVAFGDASFSHTSPGHAPSPRRRWVVERMRRVHHLDVLDIWEFNTSKVCSRCHAPRELEPIPTANSPYFAKRCTDTECLVKWNRDVNAARNMAFLARQILAGVERPRLFSVPLSAFRDGGNDGTGGVQLPVHQLAEGGGGLLPL